LPGGSVSYNATVTGGTGFTGMVTFSASGLPSGASATFNPSSISGSGSTTMKVSTGLLTLPGNYQITITGSTGGAVSHSTTVTMGLP
jgi:hypothetical protein